MEIIFLKDATSGEYNNLVSSINLVKSDLNGFGKLTLKETDSTIPGKKNYSLVLESTHLRAGELLVQSLDFRLKRHPYVYEETKYKVTQICLNALIDGKCSTPDYLKIYENTNLKFLWKEEGLMAQYEKIVLYQEEEINLKLLKSQFNHCLPSVKLNIEEGDKRFGNVLGTYFLGLESVFNLDKDYKTQINQFANSVAMLETLARTHLK